MLTTYTNKSLWQLSEEGLCWKNILSDSSYFLLSQILYEPNQYFRIFRETSHLIVKIKNKKGVVN